jgi:hypothetical protein
MMRITSAYGTFRTPRTVRSMVVIGGKADVAQIVRLGRD